MANPRIFVTGASGLIGRALLERLRQDGVEQVRALSRSPREAAAGVEWVTGDLERPASFSKALEGCQGLLHLGASTGRAAAGVHQRVNAQATRELVRAARDGGVRRFVFVSTIAAAYPELERYPYAVAKREAEQLVRESSLDWTILRPTIVLGSESGIGATLLALARKPRTPIFGDGLVRVQPLGVRDAARLIAEALREPSTFQQTLELGGPDVLTFLELLRRLRAAVGREPDRFRHLPLGVAMSAAWSFERLFGPRLPVLAGQLYAFRYDSTARASPFLDARMPRLTRIDPLIAELAGARGHAS